MTISLWNRLINVRLLWFPEKSQWYKFIRVRLHRASVSSGMVWHWCSNGYGTQSAITLTLECRRLTLGVNNITETKLTLSVDGSRGDVAGSSDRNAFMQMSSITLYHCNLREEEKSSLGKWRPTPKEGGWRARERERKDSWRKRFVFPLSTLRLTTTVCALLHDESI